MAGHQPAWGECEQHKRAYADYSASPTAVPRFEDVTTWGVILLETRFRRLKLGHKGAALNAALLPVVLP